MTPLHIDDGDLLTDNNWVENPIRPIATGRANWLFAGSLRAGKGAVAVTTLVHSTRINEHDPFDHLKDILERLPTQPVSRIQGLAAAQLVAANPHNLISPGVKMGLPGGYKKIAAAALVVISGLIVGPAVGAVVGVAIGTYARIRNKLKVMIATSWIASFGVWSSLSVITPQKGKACCSAS